MKLGESILLLGGSLIFILIIFLLDVILVHIMHAFTSNKMYSASINLRFGNFLLSRQQVSNSNWWHTSKLMSSNFCEQIV